MEEWTIVKRHVADEITLLCPFHHREKTSKRLPTDVVKEYNKNPYNLKHGRTEPYEVLYYKDNVSIKLGFMKFIFLNKNEGASLTPIIVNTTPIISIKLIDGHYSINMNLFDRNNQLVLTIKDNILMYYVGLWDVTFESNTLTVREGKYKIFIEIVFEVPNVISIPRGIIYCNGSKFIIKPTMVTYEGEKTIRFVKDKGVLEAGFQCENVFILGTGNEHLKGIRIPSKIIV